MMCHDAGVSVTWTMSFYTSEATNVTHKIILKSTKSSLVYHNNDNKSLVLPSVKTSTLIAIIHSFNVNLVQVLCNKITKTMLTLTLTLKARKLKKLNKQHKHSINFHRRSN